MMAIDYGIIALNERMIKIRLSVNNIWAEINTSPMKIVTRLMRGWPNVCLAKEKISF